MHVITLVGVVKNDVGMHKCACVVCTGRRRINGRSSCPAPLSSGEDCTDRLEDVATWREQWKREKIGRSCKQLQLTESKGGGIQVNIA